jgi:hypothetical protein
MSYNYLASILVEGGQEWRVQSERKRAFSSFRRHLITLQYLALPFYFQQRAEMEEKTRISSSAARPNQKCLSIYFI